MARFLRFPASFGQADGEDEEELLAGGLVEKAKEYTRAVWRFIQQHERIWHFAAVDFFVDELWTRADGAAVPRDWREALMNTSEDDLISAAATPDPEKIPQHWPQSLKNYFRDTREFALPRDYQAAPWLSTNGSEALEIPNYLKTHMTPKKKIECKTLAHLIDSIAKGLGVDTIIDIGAGQCYLSSVLAYEYGHLVIGIDDNHVQTCGAERRLDIITRTGRRKVAQKQAEGARVVVVKRRVEMGTNWDELIDEILSDVKVSDKNSNSVDEIDMSKYLSTDMDNKKLKHRVLLCGLHTCGDLAPAMLQHFLESDADSIINIGCCYNGLTESGLPLSQFAKDLQMQLDWKAKMVACQATRRWDMERTKCKEQYRRHFFRAVLQVIIKERKLWPEGAKIEIGRMRDRSFVSFNKYVRDVLDRHHIPQDRITDEEIEGYLRRYDGRQAEVARMWTLRALMGDMIESVILLDRWLYLIEKGGDDVEVQMFPIFDPIDSPRNMVFVARKIRK